MYYSSDDKKIIIIIMIMMIILYNFTYILKKQKHKKTICSKPVKITKQYVQKPLQKDSLYNVLKGYNYKFIDGPPNVG
jgi:uncharacterized protein YxeA